MPLLRLLPGLLLGLSCGLQVTAAATVDIAPAPMVSGLTRRVPPNVYFILDDSGSMDWDYMPDGLDDDRAKRCFRNFGYNTIYYNPRISYTAPPKADGTFYANASFTAALADGFSPAGSGNAAVDLGATTTQTSQVSQTIALGQDPLYTTNNSSRVTVTHVAHGLSSGARITLNGVARTGGSSSSPSFNGIRLSRINGQSLSITVIDANSYRIEPDDDDDASVTGSGGGSSVSVTLTTTSTATVPVHYYAEYTANAAAGSSTCQSDSAYTIRTPQTTAEKQNFANWYSYYRTRMNMMKSAAGRAFAQLDDEYRVGFSTISYTGSDSAQTGFLAIGKFTAAQKSAWFNELYGSSPQGFTPLRAALAKAGRLYGGRLITGVNDPVQYSCQQNYTILTTDGYWNTNAESSSYGPKQLDGTTNVGDRDGVTGTPRPYLDSAKAQNTLADIAQYYYQSDLRPTSMLGGLTDDGQRLDISSNNVPIGSGDNATWQHMNTFTMGLGVSGTLNFAQDYLSGGSSDYNAIIQGTKNWPDPIANATAARIDDLWHAAVNGRGQYFSATDPDNVVTALSRLLATILRRNAAASAAATSSLEPVAGDNFAYTAQYTTGLWTGELLASTLDLVTGAVSTTYQWSARSQLESRISPNSDTRTIYTFSTAGQDAATRLKPFSASRLAAEINSGYFSSGPSNPGGALSQYTLWNGAQQAAATPEALINFLRGQQGLEDEVGNTTRLFRDRLYALGDIVNSAPTYVRKPPFKYRDNGYLGFLAANQSRGGTVYVGANDGMLHAFNADTGAERWAYVPALIIPELHKLADADYATNHRYYVDGTLSVGDVYDASRSTWMTVLIGGLGAGGKGYFALDITDPDAPRALWEFGATAGTVTDADLGLGFGNPVITRRSGDGRWVALVASGYNNSAPGDSRARLYVLDAVTGEMLDEIVPAGSPADPNLSGLIRISNYVEDGTVDNTSRYVYGGDLSGNLWRFDLVASDATRLGRTSSTAGNLPITTRPELARVQDSTGTAHRVVYVATGRYLGFSDLTSTSPSAAIAQGVFAVKDSGTDLGVLTSTAAGLVAQSLDVNTSPRTIPAPSPVDWSSHNGWYVQLPVGERVSVDPRLQLGSLVAVANQPLDDYCVAGGTSWMYSLDYRSGAAVTNQSSRAVAWQVGNSISTGLTLVRLPGGKLIAIITEADTVLASLQVPVPPPGVGSVRRVIWRELR
jgi:type IV pilus assembly protein PilY1